MHDACHLSREGDACVGVPGRNVCGVYDFARRPLWILSHALVVIAVLVMVRLGFWQMSRWQEESDKAERIEAATEAEPVPLGDVVDATTPPDQVPESARYRRVVVEGDWDTDAEVVIRSRSLGGSPGGWLVTPLVQADGTALAVARGWVPLEVANAGAPFPGTAPSNGAATVVGVVGLTQDPGPLGPTDPAEGTLDTLARVDLDRYSQQLPYALEPVWVTLQQSDPAQPTPSAGVTGLQPIEVEVPSPSQNLSYMVQWWFFAVIAAVGYVLVLRKVAHSPQDGRRRHRDVPEDDPVGESAGV